MNGSLGLFPKMSDRMSCSIGLSQARHVDLSAVNDTCRVDPFLFPREFRVV